MAALEFGLPTSLLLDSSLDEPLEENATTPEHVTFLPTGLLLQEPEDEPEDTQNTVSTASEQRSEFGGMF